MVPGTDHDPDETKLPAGTPGSGGAHDAGAPGTVAPGTFVGPYKLLRYIDEGAMGEVWLAERRDTRRPKVALKPLTASGVSAREAIARFDQEREVPASMSHDHMARTYEGSEHGGRPWFAMEYVDGEPVTDFCDRKALRSRPQFGETDSRTVWIIRILVDFHVAREVRDHGQGYAAKTAEWRAQLPPTEPAAQPSDKN